MQRISVIIPVFNAAPTLLSCLQALVGQIQSGDGCEIIVVDNNSTDESLEIARSISGVRLVYESKQGAYAARNTGCRVANGDFLAFTDPDCIPGSHWISEIGAAFKDESTALIMGRQRHCGHSNALGLVADYEREKIAYIYSQSDPSVFFGHCNNMAVRRWLWEEMGPFVERKRGADTIFIRRTVDRFSTDIAKFAPEMTVRHLEISSLSRYYRKMSTYGRSRALYTHIVRARPLYLRERLRVYLQAARRNHYTLYQYLGLLAILTGGWFFWVSGTLSTVWNPKEK